MTRYPDSHPQLYLYRNIRKFRLQICPLCFLPPGQSPWPKLATTQIDEICHRFRQAHTLRSIDIVLEELPDWLRAWAQWEKHAEVSLELIAGILSQLSVFSEKICYLSEESPEPGLSGKLIKQGLGEFREHVVAMRERELLKTSK